MSRVTQWPSRLLKGEVAYHTLEGSFIAYVSSKLPIAAHV